MKRIIFIVTLMFTLSPTVSFADNVPLRQLNYNHEIRGGILAHDVDNLWSQSSRESGGDFSIEMIFLKRGIDSPLGILHPNIGITINNGSDTSKVYAGILLEEDIIPNMFFNIGLGTAIHDGELRSSDRERKWLGSHTLFRIPIEIGYKINRRQRIILSFDHISNAYLASPNEGMDTLGIRYGYLF